MERWLKMGTACKKANVCRDTMRRWCVDGLVVAKQVPAGKRFDWRIREDSLPIYSESAFDAKVASLIHTAGL